MKNLLLFSVLFLSLSVQAAITIVSDLDDTIKITEASGDPRDLLGEKIYTGMPEYYRGSRAYSKNLHILSASPSILRSKITKTLSKNGITYEGLILRTNVLEDKFKYKVRSIKKLIDQSNDDFILIGDDIGDDPEVFAEITRLYPGRILESYIHVVKARPIPAGIISYWTSFDLALREFEASRLSEKATSQIFEKLIREMKLEYVFPREANCPKLPAVWRWQWGTTFHREAIQLASRLNAFCIVRQSVNQIAYQ